MNLIKKITIKNWDEWKLNIDEYQVKLDKTDFTYFLLEQIKYSCGQRSK